ncbi:FHA domain-containing protein FHA2-like [Ananas comosus]|uniref:FHA domain-containing protein FHA2-like n=1 Tax=Ananas comosus TaxID=4615 RepID=A0A6P5GJZ2_ANACO|nr:FHA domain-containing protein FHA2-like [Ananas comosus]
MVKSRKTLGGGGGGGGGAAAATASDSEVGFAKLQGEDFEYYMQTYSIILGRNSKKSEVDVDLASLGGGMNISRHHARIFYDFARRRFALEVIGKNGCLVEGVLHVPGTPPVKLDSQDLLQMGDKQFYFLLPSRSIFDARPLPRLPSSSSSYPAPPLARYARGRGVAGDDDDDDDVDDDENGGDDDGHGDDDVDEENEIDGPREEEEEDEEEEEEEEIRPVVSGKRLKSAAGSEHAEGSKPGPSGRLVKKSEKRSRADREADNNQLLQLEEKDVISSVATVLSDLCGPGEWMPMTRLHEVLLEKYGNIWHHSRVRKYLTSEDLPQNETKGRPWFGLLALLRKYPEHFVINTRTKGRLTQEFVSLVSLLS